MRRSLLTVVALVASLLANAADYFGRHYIIVVDQTPDVQSHSGRATLELYDYLHDAFTKGTDKELAFNPATDEISVFVFGLVGAYDDKRNLMTGVYKQVHDASNFETKVLLFDDNYIQHRGKFSTSGKSMEEFFTDVIHPTFNNEDPKALAIRAELGVTLSKYLPQAILNPKYKAFEKAAKENYLLFVTNYQSGMSDKGASADVSVLQALFGNAAEAMSNRFDDLGEAFYTIPMRCIKKSANNTVKEVMIDPELLSLKSQKGNSVFVMSNLDATQREYQGHEYKISPVEISFVHDESTLKVDSLVMSVMEGKQLIYKQDILPESNYDDARKTYVTPGMTIDLGRDFSVGSNLDFSYAFYGRAIDDSGNTLMPLVYVANRDFTFTPQNLVTLTEVNNYMIWVFVCALVAVIAVVVIYQSYKIYRGKNRRVSLIAHVRPISNERFMDVSNSEVTEYDCWYWAEGDPTTTNICVQFDWQPEKLSCAKEYKYLVSARVQDLDNNEDFTFRPDRQIQKPNGDPYEIKEWFPITGLNHFNIEAYVDPNYRMTPNFDRVNILKMRVEIKIQRVTDNNKLVADDDDQVVRYWSKDYSFIVRPKIQNSNLWVAFDPGTSGSCVAYGVASNPQSRDDMDIAENMSQSIQGRARYSCIFPSRIRLNNQSQKLFGIEKIDAEMLEEGGEKDFTFGNEAEIMWNPNGVNCFQSIKKLLGYTTMLPIKSRDGITREISGQDLAHLLVKGLCNHFEDYMRTNPNVDPNIRTLFLKEEDHSILARRAIVAVPNSYTLVKIQDMVDTVKRTNKFDEVHFIFESEAAFMMYLRDKWGEELIRLQNRVFIVYDMGGATINITALKIQVHLNNAGNIDYIDVNTIAKIGYVIGGDDIDFSLIQMIYGLPTVTEALENAGEKADVHQIKHKEALLKFVRSLKLQVIDYANDKSAASSWLADATVLYGEIQSLFKNEIRLPIGDFNEEVNSYLREQQQKCQAIEKHVLDNVSDAITELLGMLNAQGEGGTQVEIIFSGRSTLYPRIKNTVYESIKKAGFEPSEEWKGFYENNEPSAELVKTAVARGACWYAMYSTRIHLHHNVLTSAFGIIDIVKNKETFIPLTEVGEEFDDDYGDIISAEYKPDENLTSVKFVQMLGTDFKHIWNDDIKHKYNLLDTVQPNQITSQIEKVVIKIDNKNNFTYEVTLLTGTTITVGAYQNRAPRLDIVKENSPAYIFATRSVLEVDPSAVDNTTDSPADPSADSSSSTNFPGRSTTSRPGGRSRKF